MKCSKVFPKWLGSLYLLLISSKCNMTCVFSSLILPWRISFPVFVVWGTFLTLSNPFASGALYRIVASISRRSSSVSPPSSWTYISMLYANEFLLLAAFCLTAVRRFSIRILFIRPKERMLPITNSDMITADFDAAFSSASLPHSANRIRAQVLSKCPLFSLCDLQRICKPF